MPQGIRGVTAFGLMKTELRTPEAALAERILVLAPTADDSAVVTRILEDAHWQVFAVGDLAALAAEIDAGVGVVVLASEALPDESSCSMLRRVFDAQEAWSEIPLLLLGEGISADGQLASHCLGPNAHIVVLERPLGVSAFLSAIDSAQRSRRRQYEVKHLLSELSASAAAIAHAHEAANRAKDEFIATLGHELRSPMTAIRGWIQLLKTGELDETESADALSMIESSTDMLTHIIEDLMDMSRIIAGKTMIEPSLIDLRAVVSNVVAASRPSAVPQQVEITADMPDGPLMVWADEIRVQQIVWNLLSNAIKFTPKGGTVRVTLRREDVQAVIRIRDSGRGIAPELLPHVFERYRQADDSQIKPQRGLGLGLAIVQHLVKSHGGTIEAFSEGLGRGAEFVVRLPLSDGR